MDSRSRRVDADVDDRLGELPDCILHDVLSRMGSRQAVQTSVLSTRWRHLWRDVPCVDIDQGEFANNTWERFEDFADHMLQPTPPPLAPNFDAFRLHLASSSNHCRYEVSDRWIRRGLRRSPASVAIRASNIVLARWIMPPQPSTLHLLTTLHLVRVAIAEDNFLPCLGNLCPNLEELHIEECRVHSCGLHEITSPVLIRLAVVKPRNHVIPAYLIHSAPRLELTPNAIYDVRTDSLDRLPPLTSITEASIQIARRNLPENNLLRKGRLEFLSSMRRLLTRLPSAATLCLSGFTATSLLDNQCLEFPTMQSLNTLVLEDCDLGSNFNVLTNIVRNTPNFEKLGLHLCTSAGITPVLKHHGVPGALRCGKLESIEKTIRRDDGPRMLDLLLILSNGMPPE